MELWESLSFPPLVHLLHQPLCAILLLGASKNVVYWLYLLGKHTISYRLLILCSFLSAWLM